MPIHFQQPVDADDEEDGRATDSASAAGASTALPSQSRRSGRRRAGQEPNEAQQERNEILSRMTTSFEEFVNLRRQGLQSVNEEDLAFGQYMVAQMAHMDAHQKIEFRRCVETTAYHIRKGAMPQVVTIVPANSADAAATVTQHLDVIDPHL